MLNAKNEIVMVVLYQMVVFSAFWQMFCFGQRLSSIVFEGKKACLYYVMDKKDKLIVEFSYSGYKNGETPLSQTRK